jgi:hypothetical protein
MIVLKREKCAKRCGILKTTLPAVSFSLLHDLVRGAVDAAAVKQAGPQANLKVEKLSEAELRILLRIHGGSFRKNSHGALDFYRSGSACRMILVTDPEERPP